MIDGVLVFRGDHQEQEELMAAVLGCLEQPIVTLNEKKRVPCFFRYFLSSRRRCQEIFAGTRQDKGHHGFAATTLRQLSTPVALNV